MSIRIKLLICTLLLSSVAAGCKPSSRANSNSNTTSATSSSPAKPNADGTLPSGTGEEKEKPAAGRGNVQGKALYNGQPAKDVEVKLCEKFNQYFGGCGGETFVAKTDAAGEYLIRNVPPRIYEGLIVKVFDENFYIFATSGIVSSAKYKIEADRTYFAPATNLFKSDLKLSTPKAGAKLDAANIEVKWQPYPDAAYYKFSIYADTATGAQMYSEYINKRIDGLSCVLDKPLAAGSYTAKVTAYNGNDIKLAESSDDIKFSVKGDGSH